jgi:hypothetical protein
MRKEEKMEIGYKAVQVATGVQFGICLKLLFLKVRSKRKKLALN